MRVVEPEAPPDALMSMWTWLARTESSSLSRPERPLEEPDRGSRRWHGRLVVVRRMMTIVWFSYVMWKPNTDGALLPHASSRNRFNVYQWLCFYICTVNVKAYFSHFKKIHFSNLNVLFIHKSVIYLQYSLLFTSVLYGSLFQPFIYIYMYKILILTFISQLS